MKDVLEDVDAWTARGDKVALAMVVGVVIFSIMMLFHFVDPRDAFSRKTIWNPMNVLFSPQLLDDRGRALRKLALRCCQLFVITFFVAAILGMAISLLDRSI